MNKHYPYQDLKVGDSSIYECLVTDPNGGDDICFLVVGNIVAKDNKEVTIQTTTEFRGNVVDMVVSKYELNKEYDPTVQLKHAQDVEKVDEVEEKIYVGGVEYTAALLTYKLKSDVEGTPLTSVVKVWLVKGVPCELAKFEATTSSVAGSIPNPLGEPHQIVYTSVVRMNLLHFDKK